MKDFSGGRRLQSEAPCDGVLECLVDRTDGFTGAQMVEVVKTLLDLAGAGDGARAGGVDAETAMINEELAERAVSVA